MCSEVLLVLSPACWECLDAAGAVLSIVQPKAEQGCCFGWGRPITMARLLQFLLPLVPKRSHAFYQTFCTGFALGAQQG